MKVYATMLNDKGEVILKEWPSAVAFLANERWCDPKFINVVKTSDLNGFEFYEPGASRGSFSIVYAEDQKQSQLLLHRKFHELRRKANK